jgi:tripartite-type tricarboxylate transporter receptor subunit TctC
MVGGLVLALVPSLAMAQGGPKGQIRLMVGYPAGGATDVLARVLAQEGGKRLGQDIIVINKPGVAGWIAANEVAGSPPDGQTIGISPTSAFTLAHLFQNIKPDIVDRTTALLQVGRLPIGFVANAKSKYKTFKDFIEDARKEPGKLAVGIPGAGTVSDLLTRAVFLQDKLQVNYVQFRGDVPTSTAVLGGHVMIASVSAGGFKQHVEAGTMRVLASMEAERAEVAPDAPTLKELGYDYAGGAIMFMYGPSKLAPDMRKKLADAFLAASRTPVYIDIAKKNSLYNTTAMVGAELGAYLVKDRARNTALVEKLGLGVKAKK